MLLVIFFLFALQLFELMWKWYSFHSILTSCSNTINRTDPGGVGESADPSPPFVLLRITAAIVHDIVYV